MVSLRDLLSFGSLPALSAALTYVGHTACRTVRMLTPCACCSTLHSNDPEAGQSSAYCDRCEVAYLEFKLKLLASACRLAAKKADEV